MKKQFLIIMGILLTGLISQAQLSISPAPSSGDLVLTGSNTYIYFTNTTSAVQTPTISLGSNAAGISISSNRCTTIRAGQSCYVIINFPSYATNSVAYSIPLTNGSTSLATIKFNPTIAPQSSLFNVNSLQMDDFINHSFSITNKTSAAKTYAPVIGGADSSRYSIVLNRCSSVAPGGVCQIFVKLAPQMAGTFSASLSEAQVTGSITVSSTITSLTVGVIQPPNPSITLSPSSASFGTITNLGKTASKSFTVTNNGNVAVSPIISVSGVEISLNRCLVLLSPNQSCSVSVLFNAVSSMTNGVQLGLSMSAQATSSTTLLISSLSATLSINPVLLSSSGGITGTPLATSLLINSGGTMFHYSTVNNKLYSWGANTYTSVVGDGTTVDRGNPYSLMDNPPLIGKSLKDFSFFLDHACLLTTDNNIYCWGYNYAGQSSPILDGFPVLVPTLIPKGDMGSKTIKKLAVGAYMSLALSEDGHVYFWGANGAGQSGSINGTSPSPSDLAYCGSPYGSVDCQSIIIPKEVNGSGGFGGLPIKDVTATYTNVCVISTTDDVFCWGSNYSGEVGDGTNIDRSTPTGLFMGGALMFKGIKKLYMAYGPSCVLTTEDLLYCWGANYFGQLGTGSTNSSENSPQPVVMAGALAGKTVKNYYPGSGTSCLIASDDQTYCWGWNAYGQLGTGSTNYSENTPQPVVMSGALAGKTIKKLSTPYYTVSNATVCAIASDDKPYCWGSNSSGQLGDGTTNDSMIPVATDPMGILSGKTVSDIASHGGSACVLANDNNVYCIGENYGGQLGNGNSNIGTSSSVFVLAPTIP